MNCTYKKNLLVVTTIAVLLSILAVGNVSAPSTNQADFYTENIVILVNCDRAKLDFVCILTSPNSTMIHYPSPVNLGDSHLIDCISVSTAFTLSESVLIFHFNGTDETAARNNADAIISSMDTAFSLTFTHNSTTTVSTPESQVVVTYKSGAKTDLATFLGDLKTTCIHAEVGGFANTFGTLFTHAENKTIVITATNDTSDWSHSFIAFYDTSFPQGSDSHTVDVLYCVGAPSLQPSEYAWLGSYYISSIIVSANSSSSLSFASCAPGNVTIPMFNAGWYITSKSGNTVSGALYFGTSRPPPIWEAITFSFQGNVIPEFSTLTTVLLIMLTSAMLVGIRKRSKANL